MSKPITIDLTPEECEALIEALVHRADHFAEMTVTYRDDPNLRKSSVLHHGRALELQDKLRQAMKGTC